MDLIAPWLTFQGGFTLDRLKGSNASVYTALYNKDYEKILMRDQEELPFYTVT